ncbi:MAG: hypothetical protein JWP39_916, partial [Jatrophihabitans sp.]|nr:hypothetical protein [Jatrophihabitans sp.]
MTAVLDPRVDPRSPAGPAPALASRDGVDALFVVVLTAVALFGFRTTYSGPAYLVTGVVAAVIGVGLVLLVAALRQSVVLTAVLVVVAFYLFG